MTPTRRHLATMATAGVLAAGLAVPSAHATDVSLTAVGNAVAGFTITGIVHDDRAGHSVSGGGDVNGDGLDDVVVGAPQYDPPGCTDCGGAFVVFGSTSPAPVALSDVVAGTGGFVIRGELTGGRAGASVAIVGDTNGDGLADVLLGAPNTDANTGAAYLVLGRTATTPVEASQVASGIGGYGLFGAAPGDLCGFSVAGAGDFNGDGLADLIVGARFSDPPGYVDGGRAYVVFGRISGGSVALASLGALGLTLNEIYVQAQAGVAVSGVGDVNGDGMDDVAVGSYRLSFFNPQHGATRIVFGRTASGTISLPEPFTPTTNGFVLLAETGGDNLGQGVGTAGDVNGDGLADVLAGASRSDPPGRTNGGRTYLLHGRTSNATVQVTALGGGSTFNGQGTSDRSGYSLAGVGDINGDGAGDFLIGAYLADPPTGTNAGRAYLVLGSTSSAIVELPTIAPGTTAMSFNGETSNDEAGRSVAPAGDVNGDGVPDLIIGSPSVLSPMGETGRAYVVFGGSTGLPATASYRTHVRIGNPVSQGIGTLASGSDASLWANARLALDFDGGAGPGLAGSSTVDVTQHRAPVGISGLPINSTQLGPVWQVATNRVGWSNARPTVRYTEADLAGFPIANVRLFRAPALGGPWTQLGGLAVDTVRRRVSADSDAVGFFALVHLDLEPPQATITPLDPATSTRDVVRYAVSFSEPVAPTFGPSAVNITGTLAAGASLFVGGADPNYTLAIIPLDADANGTLGFTIPGGVVEDPTGLPYAGGAGPPYFITHAAKGDLDNNGVVNAADVTALADHIVNGTPLP